MTTHQKQASTHDLAAIGVQFSHPETATPVVADPGVAVPSNDPFAV